MRGAFQDRTGLFSYISLEERVPKKHPLRDIRELVRAILVDMNRDFAALYSDEGRPSIPPEQRVSALLLQAFYGLRSERQLIEQLDYNLLFRWFVGLSPDAPVWVPTTFTKNRDRLQEGEILQRFMQTLLNHPRVKPLLSDEHFSVDGTLIEAKRSGTDRVPRSFRPRSRASSRKTARTGAAAPISTTKSAATQRTPARAIRKAACIARRKAAKPSFAIWVMRRWRTATAWRSAAK
jgi:transposase